MRKMQRDKSAPSLVEAWLLVFIIGLSAVIYPSQGHAAQPENELNTDAPSMALLEFLADFETEDTRWIGPAELEAMIQTGWSGDASEAAKDEVEYEYEDE